MKTFKSRRKHFKILDLTAAMANRHVKCSNRTETHFPTLLFTMDDFLTFLNCFISKI